MLEAISWADFITLLLAVTVCYYVSISLIFYRHEINQVLFKNSLSDYALTNKERSRILNSNDLIGKPKSSLQNVSHENVVAASEISFSNNDSNEIEETVTPVSTRPITNPLSRSFTQLLEEINALAYIISRNSKEEMALLFETLLARYPQLAQLKYQQAINQFILTACQQQCDFEIELSEVETWWAEAATSNNPNQS